MMARNWQFTFADLEAEAYSEVSIGYCWTAVIEEAVKSTLRSKKYPPDGWGYPGYGANGLEWGDDAIAEITDWIVENKFKVKNEHISALAENVDGTVDGAYGLILRTVAWAIQDRRKNSVDGNAVRLIKEILKTEHSVVLKSTTSEADATYRETLSKLIEEMRKVPQNWSNVAELTKRGTPRKNLPVVFKKSDLAAFCAFVTALEPLPASNQIWKAVQEVLPVREGTQAGIRAQAGREMTVRHEEFWNRDAENKMSSIQDEESVLLGYDANLEAPIKAFRAGLSGSEEEALIIGLHPDFQTLPLRAKLEAVNVETEEQLSQVFQNLASWSVSIAKKFDLDQQDINTVIYELGNTLKTEREVW